jgi:hypothetical protein
VWEIRVLLLWIVWVVGFGPFGVSSCEEQNRIVETEREREREGGGGEREKERERERNDGVPK